MPLSGALRNFFFFSAIVCCWLVVATLFVLALGIFACAGGRVGDTCPPDIIALPFALSAIVGIVMASWLWDVYKKNR